LAGSFEEFAVFGLPSCPAEGNEVRLSWVVVERRQHIEVVGDFRGRLRQLRAIPCPNAFAAFTAFS